MLQKIFPTAAILLILQTLPARADAWRLLGTDLSGNQWFIKDNYVQLDNREEGIDASFAIKGTRKDKPNEELAVGYWGVNCKSSTIYPREIYARNEADALIMIDSILVSRRILSDKIVKDVCYSLIPKIETSNDDLLLI